MSANKSSHTAKIWMRRLAASLVGLTLMLMVAAGMYSRANNIHSSGAASEFHGATMNDGDISLPPSRESDASAFVQKNKKALKTSPPPPPPSQDMQPPSPPQHVQPPPPPQPSSRLQPPPPPVASVANQEKSSDTKKQGESAQEKKNVVKGELIEAPRPEYPEEARKQKIEGIVAVTITIGEEGKVIFARAKSGPSQLYDASVAAAYKARFKPSTIDGKPVKVAAIMTYDFKLDEN